MGLAQDITTELSNGTRISAAEVEAHAPPVPGIYAWWADSPGAREDLGFTLRGVEAPLYVGMARKSLRKRLLDHRNPPPERPLTEFDWALGEWLALVVERLPWWEQLVVPRKEDRSGGWGRPLFGYAMSALATWLGEACTVSWVPLPDSASAHAAEPRVIRSLDPFFNVWGTDARRRTEVWASDRIEQLVLEAAVADRHWAAIESVLLDNREEVRRLREDQEIWVAARLDEWAGKIVDGRLSVGPRGKTVGIGELKGITQDDEVHLVVLGYPQESFVELATQAVVGPWGRLVWRNLYGPPPASEMVIGELDDMERRIVAWRYLNMARMRILPEEYEPDDSAR